MKRPRAAQSSEPYFAQLVTPDVLATVQAVATNRIVGTRDDDLLRGTDAADRINGNGGDDRMNGGDGDDLLVGGFGNDIMNGGRGFDRIVGGEGWDVATFAKNPFAVILDQREGGFRQDEVDRDVEELIGGSGNDLFFADYDLYEYHNWVSVSGGEGDDVIGGVRRAYGGDGDDVVHALGWGTSFTVWDGGAGDHDTLSFGEFSDRGSSERSLNVDVEQNRYFFGFYYSHVPPQDFVVFSGFEEFVGSDDSTTFIGDAGAVTIRGGAEADRFIGVAVDTQTDRLYGNGGNDSMSLYGGSAIVFGGDGDDTIHLVKLDVLPSALDLHGGAGFDQLLIGATLSTTVDLSLQRFQIVGQAEVLFDGFEGVATDRGNDVLLGSAGADYLNAGSGSDILTGGDGADRFSWGAFATGDIDRVTDYDRSEGDRIDLSLIDAKDAPKHNKNNSFWFIGTDEFDGRMGQLRYEVVDGDAFITGDTTGDGQADFTIVIENISLLQASDFKL
jgi:Ca2+-binding RTX toxin-like protein